MALCFEGLGFKGMDGDCCFFFKGMGFGLTGVRGFMVWDPGFLSTAGPPRNLCLRV